MNTVERLLSKAHRILPVLHDRRNVLQRSGIDRNHLPSDEALMAYTLLGDHEREEKLALIRDPWPDLQAKALVYGALADASTPELRLIEHALPHTDIITTVWDQFQLINDAAEPPRSVWHSAASVRGLWGQSCRLRFTVYDVTHLMIDPDPIFGLQRALLALGLSHSHSGSFMFPIDNGAISIKMRHHSGQIYRHIVNVRTKETPL